MAATATISTTVFTELLDNYQQTLIATFKKMLAEQASVTSATPASESQPTKKRGRKPRDPSAPHVPSTNPWILFTKRVESIIRAKETAEDTPKEKKMMTVRVKQFASDLKAKKGYEEWSDQDILTDLATWNPPEVSKQASKKDTEPKEVAAPPAPTPAPVAEPTPVPAAPAPTTEQESKPKVKKTIKKPTPEPKKVDLRFYSWTHDGEDYFTNERGDVVTTEFEWVGRFNGKKIDESVPEPADLENAEMKE